MREPAVMGIHEQDSYVMRTFCLQRLGSHIRKITELIRFFLDLLSSRLAHITVIVERLTDRCD